MHPHLQNRRNAVRDLTALIVANNRRSDTPTKAAALAEHIRHAGDSLWLRITAGTGRRSYVPSAETVDRIAELAEAHTQADDAYRILAEASARAASFMTAADITRESVMKARRYERAAELLEDSVGRAMQALHVPNPLAQPLERGAA